MLGLPGIPVAATVRPPRKGPIIRQRMPSYNVGLNCCPIAIVAKTLSNTRLHKGQLKRRIQATFRLLRAGKDKPSGKESPKSNCKLVIASQDVVNFGSRALGTSNRTNRRGDAAPEPSCKA